MVKVFLLCDERYGKKGVLAYTINNGEKLFYVSNDKKKLHLNELFDIFFKTEQEFLLKDVELYCYDYPIKEGEEYKIQDNLTVLRLKDMEND